MKAYHNVIVTTQEVYQSKIGNIHLDVNRDDVEFIKREVEVLDAPDYVLVEKGDKLIIHHNILRQKIGIQGELIESDYYITEGVYNCPPSEIFLRKRGDGDWQALDPYVFIKPIKYEAKQSSLILNDAALTDFDDNYKGFSKERGIIKYINEELKSWGLKVGDEIVFAKDSEYEFTIDGELLYKMNTHDILAKVI